MDEDLPPDVIRSPQEAALRALALMVTISIAFEADRAEMLSWLKEQGLESALAPSEARFVRTDEPTRQQIIDASWCSERLLVICWALGIVPALPPPDEQCDTQLFIDGLPPYSTITAPDFLAAAKLRHEDELLGMADQLLQFHWEARNEKLTGQRPPQPVHIGIAQERHHAINWLIGYDGAPWDEVTTDT